MLNSLDEASKYIEETNYKNLSALTNDNCKKLSLVTSAKNRSLYLFESLKSWLKFPFDEIIILDWSSDIPLSSNGLPSHVKIIRIDDKEFYEHSAARNLKVDLAKNELVLCIDSDIVLKPNFLDMIFIKEKNLYITSKSTESIVGTSIFTKTMFNEVGRFNEQMNNGWGYEDIEFYDRLTAAGYKTIYIPENQLSHIEHSDNLRTENTLIKNKWVSNSKNMKTAADALVSKYMVSKPKKYEYILKIENTISQEIING